MEIPGVEFNLKEALTLFLVEYSWSSSVAELQCPASLLSIQAKVAESCSQHNPPALVAGSIKYSITGSAKKKKKKEHHKAPACSFSWKWNLKYDR